MIKDFNTRTDNNKIAPELYAKLSVRRITLMTYKEFIQNIIDTRGQWNIPKGDYWEGHHIIPKCMGGLGRNKDKHSNIIRLYADEHYLAHKLLAKENTKNKSLIYAFWRMSTTKSKQREKHISISADDYRLAKTLLSKLHMTQTKESNFKRMSTMKSHKLHWFTNGQDEIRGTSCPVGWYLGRCTSLKIAVSVANKNSGINRSGNKNGMFGKTQSKESNKRRGDWTRQRNWYNNGEKEVFEIVCLMNFNEGRLPRKKKKWFTNGCNNIFEYDCPNGYQEGKTKLYSPWNKGKRGVYSKETINKISTSLKGKSKSLTGKAWINNGCINKAVNKEELDVYINLGWSRGMKRRT